MTLRQLELVEGLDVERNLPDDHRDAAALLEAVAAKARQVLDAEREIQLVLGLESLLLIFRQHRIRELQRVLRLHHEVDVRALHVAVDAELGALAGGDVEVGGAALDDLLEEDAEIEALRSGRGGGSHLWLTRGFGKSGVVYRSQTAGPAYPSRWMTELEAPGTSRCGRCHLALLGLSAPPAHEG